MKQISIFAVRLASVGLACSMAGSMALAAGTLTVTGTLVNNQCTFSSMSVQPTGDVAVTCEAQTPGVTPLGCTVTPAVGGATLSLLAAGGPVDLTSLVTDSNQQGGALILNWTVAPANGVTPTPPQTTQNTSFTFPANTGTSAVIYTVTFSARNSLSPTPATCSQTRTVSVAGSTPPPPPTSCAPYSGQIVDFTQFNSPGNTIITPTLQPGQVIAYRYNMNNQVFPTGALLNIMANTNIGGSNLKDIAVSGCPGKFDVPTTCKAQVGASVGGIAIASVTGGCIPAPTTTDNSYFISVKPTSTTKPASASMNTQKF